MKDPQVIAALIVSAALGAGRDFASDTGRQ